MRHLNIFLRLSFARESLVPLTPRAGWPWAKKKERKCDPMVDKTIPCPRQGIIKAQEIIPRYDMIGVFALFWGPQFFSGRLTSWSGEAWLFFSTCSIRTWCLFVLGLLSTARRIVGLACANGFLRRSNCIEWENELARVKELRKKKVMLHPLYRGMTRHTRCSIPAYVG